MNKRTARQVALANKSDICAPLCRIINGVKAQQISLKDVKVAFYGAGSSAVGVAQLIAALLQKEAGLSKEEAFQVWTSRISSAWHISGGGVCNFGLHPDTSLLPFCMHPLLTAGKYVIPSRSACCPGHPNTICCAQPPGGIPQPSMWNQSVCSAIHQTTVVLLAENIHDRQQGSGD